MAKIQKLTLQKCIEYLNSQEYKIIAVTGKMASGKNYICTQLEKEGFKSLDADLLVHKAIESSSDKIYKTFGSLAEQQNIHILNDDNTINRRELGKLVFQSSELLKMQEDIVYPVITQMVTDFIKENPKTIINATVLYKTPQLLKLCQTLIFVHAPFFTRLRRAKKRDNMKLKLILQRFNSQKNLLKIYKNAVSSIILIKNY